MQKFNSMEEIELNEETVETYVKGVPFFSDLNQDEILLVTKWFKAFEADSGATVFKEGNQSSHLCLVAEGAISIFKEISSSEHLKVADINTGGSIGEMGILDGEPVSATAIASVKSVVFIISGSDFKQLVFEHEKIGVKFLWRIAEIISLRLRRTTSLLAEIPILKAKIN